jgi:hypothetical protein
MKTGCQNKYSKIQQDPEVINRPATTIIILGFCVV